VSEPLSHELATFRKELPNLLDRVGKFALVKADKIEGVWDTYSDAIQEGYRKFGLTTFLVKQILASEPVHYFTRHVTPACLQSTVI
jgi:hypothetical protein